MFTVKNLFQNKCFTKEGWAETQISGMCEKCFDEITLSFEDEDGNPG